jgi:hypothetical protein
VDHARKARRTPGSAPARVTVDPAHGLLNPRGEEVLALEEALIKLEALDSRSSRIVELRFFGGFQRGGDRSIPRHLAGLRETGLELRSRMAPHATRRRLSATSLGSIFAKLF